MRSGSQGDRFEALELDLGEQVIGLAPRRAIGGRPWGETHEVEGQAIGQ